MLNKNDPLIGAVQEVMRRNHLEREVAKLVNEAFGIEDRKALPHEYQAEWDSVYQQVLAEGADLAALAPPHHKVTKKDVLVGRGVLKNHPSKPGKHVLAKEEHLEERKLNPHAVGMAAVKKSTGDEPPMKKENIMKAHKIAKKIIAKMNEGFNNRHGLSVNAPAKTQAVAVLKEDTSEYMDQEFERRGLQPPGGGMPGGGALKKTGVGGGRVRIDPGLKYINTATGKKLKQTDIPRKKRIAPKRKPVQQQQQRPAKPPSGIFLDNLAKGRKGVATDRRPAGTSTVPQIRQTRPAAGSNLPQGPWGGINRRGGASTRPTGLAAGSARRPAGQSAPPMLQQGTTLPPPKTRSSVIRRGGAALAAGATALAAVTRSVGNEPPVSTAANSRSLAANLNALNAKAPGMGGLNYRPPVSTAGKDNPGVGIGQGPGAPDKTNLKPQGVTARKIETPVRKVTDTEIMNAPQYKQAVKSVGGEAGARKIQAGTDVSGVGKVEKGQTIWSKVKSQLEKQPVKGFEMGANKGGAGR